jgi:diguanylate cyclase (GGDEF)-like protein
MRHLRPRDRRAAARQCLGFTGTAAIVQLTYFLATPRSGGLIGQGLSLGIPGILMTFTLLLARYAHRAPDLVWTAIPLLGVLAIVVLDVTSHDASVQAQIFLIFPVLFAASQLPRAAAMGLTVLSVIGELVVTFSSEPVRDAAFDSLYVTTAIVAAALLLTHSTCARDQLIEHLGRQVGVDALTSLMTRRALNDVAREALDLNARCHTRADGGTALILIDLDRFKSVNDTFGHPVGDDFLIHVGTFLTERLRTGDLVVARLGGDEFAILMTGRSHQVALRLGQTLLDEAMERPFRLPDGRIIPIRFTVGVGYVPAGMPSTLRDLYAQADRALYVAKSAGRASIA